MDAMLGDEKLSKKIESTYYLKPGQTLENTKISDRALALKLSKSSFARFCDYTTENERLAAAAAEEAAKFEALKKATYEMSKSWEDTIANIKKRRKEELLNRSKHDDEAREKFVEDLKARNAIDRAKIVKEARKLLLWKKPQCRLINGALLTSECYRQLDAQTAFNKTVEKIDEQRDIEYAKMIKQDVEKFVKEEKLKAEERMKNNQIYKEQLKRQINGIGNDTKRLQLEELRAEKEDLQNMSKEIRMIEECEAEQEAKRKKELKEFFTTALEDKKVREMEIKRKDDFENRALRIIARSKDRIKEVGKLKMKQAAEEKKKRMDLYTKTYVPLEISREAAEEESRRKAILEKEELERERQESKRKKEEKIHSDIEKYRHELTAIKEHRANEEKNMMAWETLQRFKRNEYNGEIQSEESKRRAKIKNEYAYYLRKQMAEREAERKREGIMGNDAIRMKEMIERTNEKVLAYGEEVLKECKELNESNPNGPARPLFPILKAIEQFKKESGLLPPKIYEPSAAPKRRRRQKGQVCSRAVPPDQICYV